VSEKERNIRKDEKERNIRKDEGEDVEGHSHHPHTKARAVPHTKPHSDEGDDVEGHIFKQSQKPSHKS